MANPAKAAPLLELSADTVKLIVGPKRREFIVHRKIVMDASPVLHAAFISPNNWTEGQERSMILPEDDSEAFNLLLHFAYVGQLPIAPAPKTCCGPVHPGSRFLPLATAYCLAERYQIDNLKNAITDAMMSTCQQEYFCPQHPNGVFPYPKAKTIEVAYNGTRPGSAIRKLMVDMFFGVISGPVIQKEPHHPEFMVDLAAKLSDYRRSHDGDDHGGRWLAAQLERRCRYHEHTTSMPCDTEEV